MAVEGHSGELSGLWRGVEFGCSHQLPDSGHTVRLDLPCYIYSRHGSKHTHGVASAYPMVKGQTCPCSMKAIASFQPALDKVQAG